MNIKTKILGGFIMVIIIGATVGIIGAISIRTLTDSSKMLHEMQKESDDFAKIMDSHYTWRDNLTHSLITGDNFTGSLDPTACALGKWISDSESHIVQDEEIAALLEDVKIPHNAIHYEAEAVLAKLKSGDNEGAYEEFNEKIMPNFDNVIRILNSTRAKYSVLMDNELMANSKSGEQATITLWIIIIIGVMIALALGTYISMKISRPLVDLSNYMERAGTTGAIRLTEEDVRKISAYGKINDEVGHTIAATSKLVVHITHIADELELIASGDLTTVIEVLSEEDVMGNSLNDMLTSINQMFREIKEASKKVDNEAVYIKNNAKSISDSTKQIAEGAQLLASGANEQANSVSELSRSAEDIAKKTQANTEMALKAATLAETIIKNAQKGSRQMDDMIKAVDEITIASKEINTIIGTINEIASQTNLLSLNASIEAARAGEHGRGFAVVASEVGKLAIESTNAASETNSIIQTSIEKAELGARIVDETAKSLTDIIAGIEESTKLIREIAKASDEQLSGVKEINRGIQEVSDIVEQNSATAEENTAASEESAAAAAESTGAATEMSNIASELHECIAKFRVNY